MMIDCSQKEEKMNLVDECATQYSTLVFSLVLLLLFGKLKKVSNYHSFQTLYKEIGKNVFHLQKRKRYTFKKR